MTEILGLIGVISIPTPLLVHDPVAFAPIFREGELEKKTHGWSFFYVDPKTKSSLRKMRSEYLESLDIELEGDEDDDDDE